MLLGQFKLLPCCTKFGIEGAQPGVVAQLLGDDLIEPRRGGTVASNFTTGVTLALGIKLTAAGDTFGALGFERADRRFDSGDGGRGLSVWVWS